MRSANHEVFFQTCPLGLSADAQDLKSFAGLLPFAHDGKTLLVFPQAPQLSVTVCHGTLLPAWFDIHTFEKGGEEDQHGLLVTCKEIQTIIDELLKNDVPLCRIVLGGFSQGGAVALYYAMHSKKAIAGAAGFSAYLPLSKEAKPATASCVPIFMSHGIHDEIIPLEISRLSRDCLRSANHEVFFQTWPLGHSLDGRDYRFFRLVYAYSGRCDIKQTRLHFLVPTPQSLRLPCREQNSLRAANHEVFFQTWPLGHSLDGRDYRFFRLVCAYSGRCDIEQTRLHFLVPTPQSLRLRLRLPCRERNSLRSANHEVFFQTWPLGHSLDGRGHRFFRLVCAYSGRRDIEQTRLHFLVPTP